MKQAKGRNKELVSLRNAKLLTRWYYWTEVIRLRWDDALDILSTQEFFITKDTMMAIIREQYNPELMPTPTKKCASKIKPPRKTQLCLFAGDPAYSPLR
jgi:hypothetical protein